MARGTGWMVWRWAAGAAMAAFAGFGSAQVAQDAVLTILPAHQTVVRPSAGSVDVVYSGTLHVPRGFVGASAQLPYAYRHGAYSTRLDAVPHPSLIGWLADSAVKTGGGDYSGPLFYIPVPSTALGGLYDHGFSSLDVPPQVYLTFDRSGTDADFESNRAGYTLAIDGAEKQIECRLTDPTYQGAWFLFTFNVSLYQGSTHLGDEVVFVDAAGNFSLDRVLPSGEVDLVVQGGHWLARRQTIAVADGASFGNVFEMVNGDIDGDNAITIFDYNILSAFFDRSNEDSDWYDVDESGFAPIQADLDGDGAVTVFDYGIVSDHFDQLGD